MRCLCDSSSRAKHGFTLVEMIVALVLGTLLLTILMGVMRRCFSEIANVTFDDPNESGTGRLVEQLRRDLTNARSIAQGSDQFELTGFIHRDPFTLVGTMRPARVRYEIRQAGQQSILARVQTEEHGNFLSSNAPFVETVYVGAQYMVLTTNEVRPIPQLDQLGSKVAIGTNLASRSHSKSSNIPSSVQIVIDDGRGRTVLNHTFMRLRDTQ